MHQLRESISWQKQDKRHAGRNTSAWVMAGRSMAEGSAARLRPRRRLLSSKAQRAWREGESGFMFRMVTQAYWRSSGLRQKTKNM